MHLSLLVSLLPAVLAAPKAKRSEPAPLIVPRGDPADLIAGQYIVKLRDDSPFSVLDDAMSLFPNDADQIYNGTFNGFAAKLSESDVEALRDNINVDFIEQDAMASINAYVTQNDPPWGLSRISHRRPGTPEYVYDDSAGQGTCSYVVDTGVDDRHPDFSGRAKQIASFIDGQYTDNNGHGTHCAGTVGSDTYGVAKKTLIYGIKVLDGQGRGSYSAIIAGINYVHEDSQQRSCPNGVFVNLSLGGPYSQASNDAVRGLTSRGYFVAVAAGNNNDDASRYSPASEPSACTVGGSAKYDDRYSQSNYGRSVDIIGPAVDVYSTLPGGRAGFKTGTSMATPHIAGLGAYLARLEGIQGPAICNRIQELATKGMVRNQPYNTVNLIAFNGNPAEA